MNVRWNDVSQFQVYWESSLIMMLSRIGILATCLILGNWLALTPLHLKAAQVAAQPPSSSIYTQQAVTEVQVTQQASDLARLRLEQDTQNATIAALRDEVAMIRGMGIAAVTIIGLLNGLQLLLQVRGKKTT